MADDLDDDDGPKADGAGDGPAPLRLTVDEARAGARLDAALAALAPQGLSRSRLKALIEAGAVEGPTGAAVREPRAKVKSGEVYLLRAPAPAPADPQPEPIPLVVAHEDAHLIVIDKPAGMTVHPAPGAPRATLVNALLAHCGASLSGIGGVLRPGIVHRIDKDTSGLLVVAKSDAAHAGLAAQFAVHSAERVYVAFCHGVPDAADPRLRGLPGVSTEPGALLRIEAALDRHPTDRIRMAVRLGGRRAVTRLAVETRFGAAGRGAARLACRLETGRTHQIRVHCAWAGHPLIGDPVYGRGRTPSADLAPAARAAAAAFPRQALHAAVLGFVHPVTGARLRFDSPLPPDLAGLAAALAG